MATRRILVAVLLHAGLAPRALMGWEDGGSNLRCDMAGGRSVRARHAPAACGCAMLEMRLRLLTLRGGSKGRGKMEREEMDERPARKLTTYQKQQTLRRKRFLKKKEEALNLNDEKFDPKEDEKIDLRRELDDETETSEDPLAFDPEAPADFTETGPRGIEREGDLPNINRKDGTKKGWDRPKEGADDAYDSSEPLDPNHTKPKDLKDDDEDFKDEDFERIALQGYTVDKTTGSLKRLNKITSLKETIPFWRSLDKAIESQDTGAAIKVIEVLKELEYESSEVISYRLVKTLKAIVQRKGILSQPSEDENEEAGQRILPVRFSKEETLYEDAKSLLKAWIELADAEVEMRRRQLKKEEKKEEEKKRKAYENKLKSADAESDKQKIQVIYKKLMEAKRVGDADMTRKLLRKLRRHKFTWNLVDENMFTTIRKLCKDRGQRIREEAESLLETWRAEFDMMRRRGEGAEQAGREEESLDPNRFFDSREIFERCLFLSEDRRTITRNDRGNAQLTYFAKWGSCKEEGVSVWAVRIENCVGGSLYIGCFRDFYDSFESAERNCGTIGVVGEAYNYKDHAYMVGSGGMAWECSERGPRPLTEYIREQLGDREEIEPLLVTDEEKQFTIAPSRILSFSAKGSIVKMKLDRKKKELSFAINQSPPFCFSSIASSLRPFVALKAVADSVTLVDPSSLA